MLAGVFRRDAVFLLVDREEREAASVWTGWIRPWIIQISMSTGMASSPSAPSSSDITRQHTPANGSVNGGSDEGIDDVEEQLPEKVRDGDGGEDRNIRAGLTHGFPMP